MGSHLAGDSAHAESAAAQQVPQAQVTPAGGALYRVLKRAFDIVFSLCVILVLLVPGLILCVVIMLDSPGGPFYAQERVGKLDRNGNPTYFKMWKFRSMVADADQQLEQLLDQNEVEGAMFKMADDPRVTRVGRFVRKHSIDEFPQFVNVLLGQMSVVGPRPPLPRELPEYTERDLQRLRVKPGLTGPWQVGGRSALSFDDMVALALHYIEHRSIGYDLKLIAKTVLVVLTGEGAH